MSLPDLSIPGSATLAEIQGTIESVESLRNRCIGAYYREGKTWLVRARQRSPRIPKLILMGGQAPEGMALEWVGTVLVEGQPANVQLYRPPAEAATASGPLSAQIEKLQAKLGVFVDGRSGPETWDAITSTLEVDPPGSKPRTNARSEAVIATLLPIVRSYAAELFFRAKAHGLEMSLISGTRTFAEQDALFALGRDAKGKVVNKKEVVTNARGGRSNHNFAIAFDVGLFENGKYLLDSPRYEVVGAFGEELGLEWGGRWRNPYDPSHFQLRPTWAAGMSQSAMLSRLRAENPNGVEVPKTALAALERFEPLSVSAC